MFSRVNNHDHWLGTRNAWVDRSISVPIYRMETQEQDGPTNSGQLSWSFGCRHSLIPVSYEIRARKALASRRSQFNESWANRDKTACIMS
jgi:hypothetical protein